jgi:hypothetical protein
MPNRAQVDQIAGIVLGVTCSKQAVGALAYRYVAQNDFSIFCLDGRQTARPVDHGGQRLDGREQ